MNVSHNWRENSITITELLDLKGIELGVFVGSKEEAINKLVDLMCATGKISDKDAYKEGILACEALTSTSIVKELLFLTHR